MYLERLELRDFRSYDTVTLAFDRGVGVLVGPNGQGKTNLLEAVHWLAVGSSHRVAGDAPLVRSGAEAAVVRAAARSGGDPRTAGAGGTTSAATAAGSAGRTVTVEVELRPGGRNRARLNGQPQARVSDVVGVVRSVLFAPEDLVLVRGDPADRRRFLDELLGQRRPAFLGVRQDYERIVRQRNALLKQGRGAWSSALDDTLVAWTDALVRAGATLLAARVAVVHALAGPAQEAYAELVSGAPGGKEGTRLDLTYELSTGRRVAASPGAGVPDPADLATELREGFAQVAAAERDRGVTLAGPHRDELRLDLSGLPARSHASHGESWCAALALRLASREVLREVGEDPVMLLDDSFAELDERRRAMLASRCERFEQVLVTAAVDADVPLGGARYRVEAGTAQRVPAGGARS